MSDADDALRMPASAVLFSAPLFARQAFPADTDHRIRI
ncbi:hypothetical protein SAHL_17065 [Salinisphaera orenii YIM 95161]|uniref:Uncharacterized protein n=1 Tax=Salinisphaera orenii YIM 95161 TaxID=1051139 RepID=A0A423PDR6_9GAMM|nr:hypothetical protein SAHL_17065 [Salinisphaera halophila YIM 95161]